jgi:hypothetical protein
MTSEASFRAANALACAVLSALDMVANGLHVIR